MTREEAINLVKQVLPCLNIDKKIREAFETLVPELHESEDEKIRKALLRCCDDWEKGRFGCMAKEDVPAIRSYLERRKTVKKIRYELDAPLSHDINGRPIYFEDLHSTEWSEEDETCLEYALWCVMKTRHFVAKDACDLDACRSAERWLNFLPKRFKLQPKQEWSKEDEEHINSIFNDFKQGVIPDEEDQEWLKNRLKSIRPQPHTVSIKNATKFGNLEYERGVKDGIQNEKKHQWKPSKEQMKALNAVANEGVLLDLFNDLLKLL